MDAKIGYIINESGVTVEGFDMIEKPMNGIGFSKDDIRFHNSDRVIGYGVLQTAEERNRNGRMYTFSDLQREINAPRQKELLNAGQMLGEQNHPLTNELVRQQTIDSRNSCVRFHKFWMEGNNVMGCFEGTSNDLGKFFDKDLRMGIKPAFSLRALGTIKSTPRGAVVENLKMITYDYVIYPSHPSAYTQGILTEGANIAIPKSNFRFSNSNDATKSFVGTFTNADVINAIRKQSGVSESAIDFIKDKSSNFKMLKECFDMTKIDSADLVSPHKIALTEAGKHTIVMNVEDYIAREIQNYLE